jgi:hypothetical protein
MERENEERTLEWTVHLAKGEPGKATAVVLVSVGAGVLSAVVFGNPIAFLVGFLSILGSTAEFLLPVQYRLDGRGARRKVGWSLTQIEWKDVRRVIEGTDGVKLSPLEQSSRLAPFRGVYLRFGSRQHEVLDLIAYWREQHAAGVGETAD